MAFLTVPHTTLGMSVRALRIDVLEGPDRGKSKIAEEERLTLGTAPGNDLVLTDPTVSRFHVELTRTENGVRVIDPGSTNGVFAGNIRIESAMVAAGTALQIGGTTLRISDGQNVTLALHGEEQLGGLRGSTAAMRRLMAQIQRAAQSDVPVLLAGESGTGKELIAKALHALGPRAKEKFVTVDCASLSPTLVGSELFGHERGAFTGADRRHIGAFEQATGGTVFLDEIGELPPALQATLLGVLERRTFRRLGGSEEVSVDVRVVSATHRDLRSEVNSGTFRLDLYYRMAVVALRIPSLRERPEDIPLLVDHFLRECGCDEPMSNYFSADAMRALVAHHWPGNVRELRNLVEATVAMGESPKLDAVETPAVAKGVAAQSAPAAAKFAKELSYKDARNQVLAEFERHFISEIVERAEGNISRAAREANMDRSHLADLLRRHNIRP